MFLESLEDKEVNYNCINDLNSHQDDQEDQECPITVCNDFFPIETLYML